MVQASEIRYVAKEILRRVGLYPMAAWGIFQFRKARWHLRRPPTNTTPPARPHADKWEKEDDRPHRCDVICLPVIPWRARFQRPQQLMTQFAERGHWVFQADLRFCRGTEAEITPLRENVYEMCLPGNPDLRVYQQLPRPHDVTRMAAAITRLRKEYRITSAVVVVQLPFWTALAEELRTRFGWPIVYDCMDDHAGFSTNNAAALLQAEERTIQTADLVVTTSDVLYAKVQAQAQRAIMVRNACDYEHFAQIAQPPKLEIPASTAETFPAAKPPTVGFYGAIAEWFDSDLAADLAAARPAWQFELVGSTFTGDVSRLETLPNVKLLGEKPYAELPGVVAGWDCFIIPFKRMPLTEATNPVKAYEMLATGKPLVAVDLPELRPLAHDGLLQLADDSAGFAAAIEHALATDDPAQRARRRAFAAQNTWADRADALEAALPPLFPLASIIIATYNNLELNKACLDSIFSRTDYPNYEVIVVDNASTDGTAEWLTETAAREPRLRIICNAENRGFAGGNNQGLRIARGEYICLLNNDTLVTHGWLATLIGHLRKTPRLGLVGPVSNNVGNEAKVPVEYQCPEEMPRWAQWYCRAHDGQTEAIDKLGFFCVVMPRSVFERVGELDERFGLGYFEDDDYCYRIHRAGYDMRFARDAFVHHWKEASFRQLKHEEYLKIFYDNREKFRRKWASEPAVGAR